MVWLVGALLLLWWAWGPLVLVVAALALGVPRIRWWVQDRAHVSRRVVAWVSGAAVAVVALVVAVPDGWLAVPPAPGAWSGPAYVGRPASPRIPAGSGIAHNPHLAPLASERSGPLGLQPEVETSWFGLQRCARLGLTSTDRLVGLCSGSSGSSLRLVDPDSMRPTAMRDLAASESCAGDAFYLDADDRAVVATSDRRVLAVRAVAVEGADDLATDTSWDLKPYVPFGDCVVGLAPDWSGRIWWASSHGLVGTISEDSGQVRVIDLGEDVRRGLTADDGGVYVVTDTALHRLAAGPDGTPQATWRTAYDGGSGSAPVLVDGGAVAITDTGGDDRMGVLFVAREGGQVICRQPVFAEGDGATASDLAPLGTGVVVTNNHGYSSPRSTLFGLTTSHGIARVDLVDGECEERWSSDAVSPSSGVVVSHPQQLVYAWTKRPSLMGVSAWYLTALDAESGRIMWSVRTGTGLLAGSDGSQILIGPGGSAWLGTLAGLVRVSDRS